MGNSFSTIWTGWKETRPVEQVTVQNGELMEQVRSNYLDKEFRVRMEQNGVVIVNIVYFPGWNVTIDSHTVPILYQHGGLVEVVVPQCDHTVRAWFGETTPRFIGDALSAASLVIILGYTLYRNQK